MENLSADLRWLVDLLQVAGQEALRLQAEGLVVRRKADATLVTDADLAVERIVLAGLAKRFPRDAVRSEEQGGALIRGESGWVVDPIDGTSAFTEGLAHWGPTVARVGPSGVELGALVLPRTGEWFAVEGDRAWANGVRLGPIDDQRSPAVLYLPSRFHAHFRVDFRGKARCLGGTAAHLALIARGSARAAIVAPGWALWDTAAGLALINAVGGVALRLPDGLPLDPVADEGAPFVAGTPGTVAALVAPGRLTSSSAHPPSSS